MSQSRKVARPLPDIHWAPAECIGDYALTETQQRLRTDCWKRVLIVAKHARRSCPPAALSGSDACCQPG